MSNVRGCTQLYNGCKLNLQYLFGIKMYFFMEYVE